MQPRARKVAVSAIFKWFENDFTDEGALPRVLLDYGPAGASDLIRRGDYGLSYWAYHWGLNDAAGRGVDHRPSLFRRLF